MADIQSIQEEIISEFGTLGCDPEMTIYYVMELGQRLPPMAEALRTEENIVKGCQSKVWLHAHLADGRVFFSADSNTAITKGLVSLLVRIFNGQIPDAILAAELHFMKAIGMERFIGTQRSNGFAAMIKQIKLYALAFKSKQTLTAAPHAK
jgi:cysteine desulfuration protein SufE